MMRGGRSAISGTGSLDDVAAAVEAFASALALPKAGKSSVITLASVLLRWQRRRAGRNVLATRRAEPSAATHAHGRK